MKVPNSLGDMCAEEKILLLLVSISNHEQCRLGDDTHGLILGDDMMVTIMMIRCRIRFRNDCSHIGHYFFSSDK